jgi:hypothetical protein
VFGFYLLKQEFKKYNIGIKWRWILHSDSAVSANKIKTTLHV